jgi:hypothetical protein
MAAILIQQEKDAAAAQKAKAEAAAKANLTVGG